jgi:hypothetical protein
MLNLTVSGQKEIEFTSLQSHEATSKQRKENVSRFNTSISKTPEA